MATREEIDQLKKNWEMDPCWDIEKTEGFEEHKEELLAWRKEYEEKIRLKIDERKRQHAEKVLNETGIVDPVLAQSITPFSEIYSAVTHAPDLEAIALEQVHVTLLLAAQVKRVADALESKNDTDSLEESVRIWGSGK